MHEKAAVVILLRVVVRVVTVEKEEYLVEREHAVVVLDVGLG